MKINRRIIAYFNHGILDIRVKLNSLRSLYWEDPDAHVFSRDYKIKYVNEENSKHR